LNLAVNAMEAMPDGGRLSLTAAGEGGTVCVTVADTGPGIDPHIQTELFEPFFTTKPAGTGLGLAIVARVAQCHGGDIAVSNRPGGGAAFTLRLPAAGPQEVAA
jgi:signal transduction histidine kinase